MAQMRLFSDDNGMCDILIVHADHKDYAVAAPAWEAVTGYLVEFRVADNMTMVGQVKDLMHCKQFEEEWRSVAAFTRIHDAVAIYRVSWSEADSST